MKAKVIIQFKKINGMEVDAELLKKVPKLKDATIKTTSILCEQIKKYFNDHNIKTNVAFTLEDE